MAAPGAIPSEAIYAGDDWSRVFTIKDENGVVVDLPAAGWTGWKAQWRPTPGSTFALDITVDDSAANTGVITLSLTGAQTESMGSDGTYDVQATDGGGQVVTWLLGSTTWTQDVTR